MISKISKNQPYYSSFARPRLAVNPKKAIFYTVFFLIYCFSGLLTVVPYLPYRMGLVSFLALPLILLYGLKIDRVSLSYVVLTLFVGLSAVYNQSTLFEFLLFLRILIFSFLIYYLVNIYIAGETITQVLKLALIIGVIQLPVVILQQLSYPRLPNWIRLDAMLIDFDFGTFNFKGDSKMSFFLTSLVIYLLFGKKQKLAARYRWLLIAWFSLTVLVVNSEVMKLVLALVWFVYFLRSFSIKTILYSLIVVSLVFGSLSMSGQLDNISADFFSSLENNARIDYEGKVDFLSGNYARGSGIAYYLDQPILWFGAGPSKYFDPFTKTLYRGNTGHIYTFYSEIGLFGWLLTVLIFFLIAFPMKKGKIIISWVGIMIFIAVQLLSFTTQVMNDISVVFTYCLISRTFLLTDLKEVPKLKHSGDR
jgi:hypothetical protein